jgi:hypothetical protein
LGEAARSLGETKFFFGEGLGPWEKLIFLGRRSDVVIQAKIYTLGLFTLHNFRELYIFPKFS